jgi:hypothetical protein
LPTGCDLGANERPLRVAYSMGLKITDPEMQQSAATKRVVTIVSRTEAALGQNGLSAG